MRNWASSGFSNSAANLSGFRPSGVAAEKWKAPALQTFGENRGFEFAQCAYYLIVSGMVVNCSAAVTPLLVCAQMVSV